MPVVATAGHVDHGKSSLVTALTGTDPDRLVEEKRRGMTIELGFASRTEGGTTVGFVDVPGHADLVRTMIAGASAVGTALLVVDAREGPMPQTLEHLTVLELLGVRGGVVAISRCDLVDDGRLDEVRAECATMLADSPIAWDEPVATSTVDGRGVDELWSHILARVNRDAVGVADDPRRRRLFVDRVFSLPGVGTVVTGTLENGRVGAGDEMAVVRTGTVARIRSAQVHGVDVGDVPPATRCALGLSGVDVADLRRGDALVAPGEWTHTDVFDVALVAARGVAELPRTGGGHTVHVGTDRRACTLRPLAAPGLFRVRVGEPWPLAPGDRLVLRRTGDDTTVAGGTVLDVAPVVRASRAAPDGTVDSQLADHGWIDVDAARRLTGRDVAAATGRWCAATATVTATREKLDALLEDGDVHLDRLEPWERAMVEELAGASSEVVIEVGVARRGGDSLEAHPVARAIRESGVTGPSTSSLDRDVVRRLVAGGIVFEHDGIAFHRDVLEDLRPVLDGLFSAHPTGFTVSQLREALGITRKHAVPLAVCLDRAGLTSRRGDARVPGPRR